MLRLALKFFSCILTFFLLLLQCTSLSQDGELLLTIRKEDWRDSTNALSNWNEAHQNPCVWKGISCDKFNTVTTVDLTGALISGNLTSAICGLLNLTVLSLRGNAFSGPFPHALLQCKQLRKLDLSQNQFTGTLPTRISEMSELGVLNLSHNAFNGTLPSSFQDCKSLRYLFIDNNQLSGEFPPGPWGAVNLQVLFLNNNNFEGHISATIGQAKNLNRLKISNNRFEGPIPPQVGKLISLQVFEASNNQLSGPIPHELGSLSLLNILYLDHNFLSEEIPKEILSLKKLHQLNLGHNRLTGEIPLFLGGMNSLDLSNNLLSGGVPPELGRLRLNAFDLSNNRLSGRIPKALDHPAYKKSFLGNPRLCGGQNLRLHSCSSTHKLLLLATILLALLLIVAVILSCICLRGSALRNPSDATLWEMTSFHSTEVDEAYIVRNLKETNVIGSGGAGKVYKVILPNGQALAVKKIRNTSRSGENFNREGEQKENIKMGEAEVEILGLIRHTNILKLLCCISSDDSDFKLLVYEFMTNGSLFDRLHGDPGQQTPLQWPIRYQIALDAARGLSYMHHDCSPPILHRDVKSSNILLDGEFKAKIADFGASRVLGRVEEEHTVPSYVGSHGYIAPEYARTQVNERSDVYSFGVVMLELVSGMKAVGEAEYGEGVGIVDWVRNTIAEGGGEMEALDERIVEDSFIDQMLSFLRLGLDCCNMEPKLRPCMRKVVKRVLACGRDNLERISIS